MIDRHVGDYFIEFHTYRLMSNSMFAAWSSKRGDFETVENLVNHIFTLTLLKSDFAYFKSESAPMTSMAQYN